MRITESVLRRMIRSVISEQNSTKCLTSGAQFHISIEPDKVGIDVDFPFQLNLSESQAKEMETLLHNAIELVLRGYWDLGEKKEKVSPEIGLNKDWDKN